MNATLLASLTCFRESFEAHGLEWVVAQTHALDLDGLELWNVRGEMANLAAIERLLRDTGVRSPSYCCVGTRFAGTPSERRGAREVVRRSLDICHRIGATWMRIDLGRPAFSTYAEAKPLVIESLTPCVEDARAAGVVLAIHNHGRGWTGESGALRDLVETMRSPWLRCRVCPGNFLLVESEPDPVAAACRLLDLAGGVFLKDWRVYRPEAEDPLPTYEARGVKYTGSSIGQGVIDYPRFFQALQAANDSAVLVLNIERGAESDLTALRQSVAFVRRLLGHGK